MLNINDLYEIDRKKEELRNKTYKKVLLLCHNKIKTVATNGTKYCWFETPEVIIGLPHYNLIDVTIYIKNNLIENGFEVDYYNPNILFISWKRK